MSGPEIRRSHSRTHALRQGEAALLPAKLGMARGGQPETTPLRGDERSHFQSHIVTSYSQNVTQTRRHGALRDRLYEAYASQHAGCGSGEATALIYRRDIRPALPAPRAGLVVDIGCGQGELVRLLLADGYDAEGIDVSPEQVALARAAGL